MPWLAGYVTLFTLMNVNLLSIDQVERERIRPIQRNSHLKIADCYANKNASAEEVENCANRSSIIMQQVQQIIQNEMNTFQNRVNRCAQQCSDDVNDSFANKPNNASNQAAAESMMHNCAQTCVDKHIAMLKSVQSKIEKDIDQLSK